MMPAVTLAAALSSHACTLVGALVGNGLDVRAQKHRPAVPVEDGKIEKISNGTPVMVTLDSGERIEGRYAGLDNAALSREYAAAYDAARDRLPDRQLPVLGQPVALTMPSDPAVTGVFMGFASDSVLVRPNGQALVLPYRLREAVSLSAAGGGALSGADIARLIADRQLPVLTRMTIDKRRVPAQEVANVAARRRSHQGLLTGAAVGALIDVAVVVWVRSSLNDMEFDWPSGPLLTARTGRN
jgi:hypothetical protein